MLPRNLLKRAAKKFLSRKRDNSQSTAQVITSAIFDEFYYLENNLDILVRNLNPQEHFTKYGQFENRDPARTISVDWLNYKYSKVFENPYLAILNSISSGEHLSPSPLFNSSYYLEQIGGSEKLNGHSAYDHFLSFGLNQGINPNPWLNLEKFSNSNPWFFNSAKSSLAKFVNLFELVRSNSIFNEYVCFSVENRAGHTIQVTQELVEEYLKSRDIGFKRTIDFGLTNWEICDLLDELAEDDFKAFLELAPVRNYPPRLLETTEAVFNEKQFEGIVSYCHWASSDHVADWVVTAIQEFKKMGLEVVFNTNVELKSVPKAVFENSLALLRRSNAGHDFESHILSWNWLKENQITSRKLVLTNDSVFFPVSDTELLKTKISQIEDQFFSLTQNEIPQSHPQSYFLVLPKSIQDKYLNWVSEALANWKYISKIGLINNLELQASSFLTKSGIKQDYFYTGADPMFNTWDKLSKFGIPVLKVHLVRKLISTSPGDTPLLKSKLDSVFNNSQVTTEQILDYVRYLEINRAPSSYWFNQPSK